MLLLLLVVLLLLFVIVGVGVAGVVSDCVTVVVAGADGCGVGGC